MVLAVHDICTGSIWQRCQFSPVQSGYPDNTWIRNLAEKRTRNHQKQARFGTGAAVQCSVSVCPCRRWFDRSRCLYVLGCSECMRLWRRPGIPLAQPQEGFCDGESGYGGTRIGEILAPPSLCARCAGTKLLSEEVLDFSLVAWQLSHLMISVSCPV